MADTPEAPEDLTSDASFDINDIIARAIADESAEPVDTSPDDAADGPDSDAESGELTAENSADAEDTSESEAPDEEPEHTDGDAAPAKPVVDVPKAEEPKAPEPPKVDPQVAALQDLVAQQQQAIRDLLAAHTQQQPKAVAPAQAKVSEDAVRLALFGGAEGSEAWKALNPQDRAEATRVAQEYFKREAKAAVDPAARLREIEEPVLALVSQLVAPLVQDFYDRQAAQTFESVAKSAIKDPADKKRLQELYSQHPGSRGQTLAEQKTALEVAAQRLDIERQKKELDAQEKRLSARSQDQANRKPPKRGAIVTPGSVRRSDTPNKKPTEWNSQSESMLEYINRLAAIESAGA